jgi:pimeloyl-ACP methyl ester carboxylesterase
MAEYDEFSLFADNAAEAGLAYDGPPTVRRVDHDGISALLWGEGEPELALVHGGAQNAHTWDTVALALDRPLVALDLPGHGHSAWRDDHDYRPATNAVAIASAIEALAPQAQAVVGMSLGGLTCLAVADQRPDLLRRLCLVDVTPGVNSEKSADIRAFVSGPEYFESFDEILERTVQFNPTRSESSLRRGILHNAHELDDGRWSWRYDRFRMDSIEDADFGMAPLWDVIGRSSMPLLLLRGALSPVVDDADVAEVKRRRPDAEVIVVDDAGHSIQGDRPVELARLLDDFVPRP